MSSAKRESAFVIDGRFMIENDRSILWAQLQKIELHDEIVRFEAWLTYPTKNALKESTRLLKITLLHRVYLPFKC